MRSHRCDPAVRGPCGGSAMMGRTTIRGFVAMLAVAVLSTLACGNAMAQAPAKARVIVQVSDDDPAKWNLALNNVRNLQSDLGPANVEIELVSYGPGIG